MLRRVVAVVEVLAVFAAIFAVVMLFANEGGTSYSAPSTPGAQLFAANCASCHGAGGAGGVGPALVGGVAQRQFPNAADQVDFVNHGRGIMPAFAGKLTPAQIRQVVAYTRTL